MYSIDNCKLVEINRLSPASMEYYVSIIDVFGARGMYHFAKKSDAKKCAQALRKYVLDLFDKASEADKKEAVRLLKEYEYKNIEDYKYLIDNSKSDIYLEYV